MSVVWILIGAALVIGFLYLRLRAQAAEAREANAQAEALEEKLDLVEARFLEQLKEDRRDDIAEAGRIDSDAGAIEFLRDSFGPRSGT